MLSLISLVNGLPMTAITIRNLDEGFKAQLRQQAARNGRSMEEEARQLLRQGLQASAAQPVRLTLLAQSFFGQANGVELELPPREAARDVPEWPA